MDKVKILREVSRLVGDYLTYNRAEQRGIFVLSLILLAVIVCQSLIPPETFRQPPDFRAFAAEITAFEAEWKKAADSDSLAGRNRFTGHGNGYQKYRYSGDSAPRFTPKPVLVIDLNRADTFDLQQLRGIGPGFARRIVNYRERLGGYHEPVQVLEVFGMDTSRYAMIKNNLTVKGDSVRRMDINTVTFKELLHHPYFPFPITKTIMLYRQKNKVFRTLEELKNIQGVNDSLFRKMVVYLRIGP